MAYYSERNGLKQMPSKTSKMSLDAYNAILQICERMFKNLAWKFPLLCEDNNQCIIGEDRDKLFLELEFIIPSVIRNNELFRPQVQKGLFYGDYADNFNQYVAFDLIEYICKNAKDFDSRDYHSFFQHHHLRFKSTNDCIAIFREEINEFFNNAGLLYELDENFQIQRIVTNESQIKEVFELADNLKDNGLKILIDEAIKYYKKPGDNNIHRATEKLWDAFERIKTEFSNDKKKSASELISKISDKNNNFRKIIEDEFHILTDIGNQFCIRHYETDKIELNNENQYEYLFNRCFSVILLSLKYLND